MRAPAVSKSAPTAIAASGLVRPGWERRRLGWGMGTLRGWLRRDRRKWKVESRPGGRETGRRGDGRMKDEG